jgi:hypothetical protein
MRVVLLILALLAVPASQQSQQPAPSRPTMPEIAKTVQAIQGIWHGKMTANVPGSPPAAFDWTMTITETLLWRFPDTNTIDKVSEVQLADGSLMRFEFKGQRR